MDEFAYLFLCVNGKEHEIMVFTYVGVIHVHITWPCYLKLAI